MYFKKVNYDSNRACFEFLANHFKYPTMNSWNGLYSIANNVKLWNLPVDTTEAFKALEEDEYESVNQTIRDWEYEHEGYEVYFNGRSGGYLVLTRKGSNGHVFDNVYEKPSPCEYDNYEYWKQDVKEEWGTLKEFHNTLVGQVKIVQEFDKLCDDLIEVVKELIKDMKRRKELTRKYSATLRFQRYYYDSVEDLKLHMLDMKRRGYSVWEYDEEDLFAEYEMNEAIESEIVLEEDELC